MTQGGLTHDLGYFPLVRRQATGDVLRRVGDQRIQNRQLLFGHHRLHHVAGDDKQKLSAGMNTIVTVPVMPISGHTAA